ncbi:MAG: radical SAM protein [Clostridia bacterium]|nr:radical SAM protein [Clostridia bacterium]
MSVSYEELTFRHPCFAKGKKGENGRIHLPVSPGCNIECKFCDRQINDFENRPGVASTVLRPEEALDVVRRSLELCPDITVAGIAGPGDTLATSYALDTFRLIKEEFPQLLKCMSTNGLLLPDKADGIIEVGIDSLTVTVNAVDPKIEAELNGGVFYHGKYYTGVEAAEILIHNQLEGIRRVTAGGITVKVNTVLVPEINIDHIETVAKTVSEAGASIYNIIPLIPQHELAHCTAPSCLQIDGSRTKAEKYIDVFRHCQRCRADAIGIPGGKDYGDQIYLKRVTNSNTFSHG